ncbi:hypothetical protein SPRG_00948 [Saprolegnia parasitica CBS 223.65]|uniref:Uncharacterized protein n=1 Tax=Saprolegnia parasitica (strain CBS 223.65) TaxID=695850 RepID=A0A067D048_SAPPC|nr:hypothetical protein SPRG_00948 [Saprolegnia parasitica CBS 223.65]KDO34890.1 hypothetical protein SPRG_00948 [Saprolegnia parasitica CBS 223.65]|eukprot:XP_012194549.1 hypothetical protein SPRG_00948 [Saprolegnia parasitica CBS 223.65]
MERDHDEQHASPPATDAENDVEFMRAGYEVNGTPDKFYRQPTESFRHVAAARFTSRQFGMDAMPYESDFNMHHQPHGATSPMFAGAGSIDAPLFYGGEAPKKPVYDFVLGSEPASEASYRHEPRTEEPMEPDVEIPLTDPNPLYHVVNPSFMSVLSPLDTLYRLEQVVRSLEFSYEKKKPWQMEVHGLLCAEEVTFRLGLTKPIDSPDVVQVDGYLLSGDEGHFLRLFDVVRSECSAFDKDALEDTHRILRKSEAWLNIDAMPEVFPGSGAVSDDVMMEYCNDYIGLVHTSLEDTRSCYARLEMAKTIKNCCLTPITQYAVYVLYHFRNSIQSIKNLETIDMDLFLRAMSKTSSSSSNSVPRMKTIARTLRHAMGAC